MELESENCIDNGWIRTIVDEVIDECADVVSIGCASQLLKGRRLCDGGGDVANSC